MTVKVSIIMGIYNCEKTLVESVESIINQTYVNWELIMCDDGSKDKTFEIANNLQKKEQRIKVIRNKTNIGLAGTLNYCLKLCTGIYIMRHDGDDLMVPDRIEKQVNYMEENQCDACGSGAYLFDDKGVWGIRQPEQSPDKTVMVTGAPFIHPTVIMKHDKLLEVGGYSDNELTRKRLEDYDLWIKFYEYGYNLQNIQEPLIYFREDKFSYSRKSRIYRITETKARFNACGRLEINYMQRIFALKPLIVMLIPKKSLRKYHIKKASNYQTKGTQEDFLQKN